MSNITPNNNQPRKATQEELERLYDTALNNMGKTIQKLRKQRSLGIADAFLVDCLSTQAEGIKEIFQELEWKSTDPYSDAMGHLIETMNRDL